MSATVDNRVVSMEFDNAKFEKNVEESLNTLKKLNSSLDNLGEGSAKGIDTLTNALGNVKFDAMAASIDSISNRFGLLGQIGTKIIGEIADGVVGTINKVKGSIDSLTVDQVSAGWQKYGEKATSVGTIMSATGESIDYVTAKLDELLWYTDETSYDFTDMSNNIGKFTSNGVDLETAVVAMEGISNWAALSGQNAQKASIAMYNLSQAISTGSLKLQDWRSIELANMATTRFKDTLMETAVELGTVIDLGETTELGEKIFATAEKGSLFTANSIREVLKEGIITNDVLLGTLAKFGAFTGALKEVTDLTGLSTTEMLEKLHQYMDGTIQIKDIFDELEPEYQQQVGNVETLAEAIGVLTHAEMRLGMEAFEAGQEARTFGDAIKAVKDYVSSQWMRLFENIFGNYQEAKKMWTSMANDLAEIFGDGVGYIADNLKRANTSSYDYISMAVQQAGINIDNFESKLIDVMKEHGYDVDALIEKYGSLGILVNEHFRDTEELQDQRERFLDETIASFRTFTEIEKDDAIIQAFKEHFIAIDDLIAEYGSLNSVMKHYFDNSIYKKSDLVREEILRRADQILETKHLNEREQAIIKSCRLHGVEIDALIEKYGSLDSVMSEYFNDGSLGSMNLKDLILKDAHDMLNAHTTTQKKIKEITAETATDAHNNIVKYYYAKYGDASYFEQFSKSLEEAGYNMEILDKLAEEWAASNKWDPNSRKVFSKEEIESAGLFGQEIEEVITQTESLRDMLEDFSYTNISPKEMIQSTIINTISGIRVLVTNIRDMWHELIPEDSFINFITELTIRMKLASDAFLNFVENNGHFNNLLSILLIGIKSIMDVIGGLVSFITPLISLVKIIILPIEYLIDLISVGTNIISNTIKELQPLKTTLYSLSSILTSLVDLLRNAIASRLDKFYTNNVEKVTAWANKFSASVTTFIDRIKRLADAVKNAKSFGEAMNYIFIAFKNVGKRLKDKLLVEFNSIKKEILSFKKMFSSLMNGDKESAKLAFADTFIGKTYDKIKKAFQNVKADLSGFLNQLDWYKDLSKWFNKFKIQLSTRLKSEKTWLTAMFSNLLKGNTKLAKFDFDQTIIGKLYNSIKDSLNKAKNKLDEFLNKYSWYTSLKTWFNNFKSEASSGFESERGSIKKIFDSLISGDTDSAKIAFKETYIGKTYESIVSAFDTAKNKLISFLSQYDWYNNLVDWFNNFKTKLSIKIKTERIFLTAMLSNLLKGDITLAKYDFDQTIIGKLYASIKDSLEKARTKLDEFLSQYDWYNSLKSWLNDFKTNASSGFSSEKESIEKIFNSLISGNKEDAKTAFKETYIGKLYESLVSAFDTAKTKLITFLSKYDWYNNLVDWFNRIKIQLSTKITSEKTWLTAMFSNLLKGDTKLAKFDFDQTIIGKIFNSLKGSFEKGKDKLKTYLDNAEWYQNIKNWIIEFKNRSIKAINDEIANVKLAIESLFKGDTKTAKEAFDKTLIGKAYNVLINGIKDGYKLLKEKLNNSDWFNAIKEWIYKLKTKIVLTIRKEIIFLKGAITNLLKGNTELARYDFEQTFIGKVFLALKEALETGIEKLKEWIKNTKIGDAIIRLKQKFNDDGISGIWKSFKQKIVDSAIKIFGKDNWITKIVSTIFGEDKGTGIIDILKRALKILLIFKVLKGLYNIFTSLSQISGTLRAIKWKTYSEAFRNLASGILSIGAAVFLLSLAIRTFSQITDGSGQGWKGLALFAATMVVFVGGIIGLIYAVNKILDLKSILNNKIDDSNKKESIWDKIKNSIFGNDNIRTIKAIGGVILAFAVSIGIIAATMALLTKMSFGRIVGGLITIGLIVAAMVTAITIIGKVNNISNSISGIALSFLTIAVGLKMIINTIIKLTSMFVLMGKNELMQESWTKACMTVLGIIVALGLVLSGMAGLISKFGSGFNWTQGLGLILAAVAIGIMSAVAKSLLDFVHNYEGSGNDYKKAGTILAAIAGVLSIVSVVISFIQNDHALSNSVVLFVAAISIGLLSVVATMIAAICESISKESILAACGIILAVGIAISLVSWAASKTESLKGGLSSLMIAAGIAGGLLVVAIALKKLSEVGDISENTIAVMVGAILSLGFALVAFSKLGWGSLAIGILGLAAVVTAVYFLGAALGNIGTGLETLKNGLDSISTIDLSSINTLKFKNISESLKLLGGAMIQFSIASLFNAGKVETTITSMIDTFSKIKTLRDSVEDFNKDYNLETSDKNLENAMDFLRKCTVQFTAKEFGQTISNWFVSEGSTLALIKSLDETFSKILSIKDNMLSVASIDENTITNATDNLTKLVTGYNSAALSLTYDTNLSSISEFGSNIEALMQYSSSFIEFTNTFGASDLTSKITDATSNFGYLAEGIKDALYSNWGNALDFSGLSEIGNGLNSFEDVTTKLANIASLGSDANLEKAKTSLNDLFGDKGALRSLMSYQWNTISLDGLSGTLTNIATAYQDIIDKADTFSTDIVSKTQEFINAGKTLLDAFVDGLNGKTGETGASESYTMTITDLIIKELTSENNLKKWTTAGEQAADSFVLGVTNRKNSIIDSISNIVTGISETGNSLGEIDVSKIIPDNQNDFNIGSLLGSLFGGGNGNGKGFDLSSLFNFDISSFTGEGGFMSQIQGALSGFTGEDGIMSQLTTSFSGITEQLTGFTTDINGMIGTDGSMTLLSSSIEGITTQISGDLSTTLTNLTSETGGLTSFETGITGLNTSVTDFSSTLTDSLTSSLGGFSETMTNIGVAGGPIDTFKKSIEGLNEEGGALFNLDTYFTNATSEGGSMSLFKSSIDDITASISGLSTGIASAEPEVLASVQNIGAMAEMELGSSSRYSRWFNAGVYLITGLANGIASRSGQVVSTVMTVDRTAASMAGGASEYNVWFGIGGYLISGLANGITSKVPVVAAAARNAVLAAKQAAEVAGQIKSPSRLFMKIGGYLTEGMAIGMTNEEDSVKKSSEEVVNKAMAFAEYAANSISGYLNSDYSPTIRPVLDLSSMSGLYNLEDTYGAIKTSTDLSGSISANISKIQNDSSTPIPVKAMLDSETITALSKSNETPVNVNVGVQFEGSLAQLATLLYPYLNVESERVGPSLINA